MDNNTFIAEEQRLLDRLAAETPGTEGYDKVEEELIKLTRLVEELDKGRFERATKEIELDHEEAMNNRKFITSISGIVANVAMFAAGIYAEETRCIVTKMFSIFGKIKTDV